MRELWQSYSGYSSVYQIDGNELGEVLRIWYESRRHTTPAGLEKLRKVEEARGTAGHWRLPWDKMSAALVKLPTKLE